MPRAVGNLIAHPFVMRGRAMEDGYGSTPKACEQDASSIAGSGAAARTRACLRRSGTASATSQSVGPENPIRTPPGARTMAMRTPSMTVSGGFTDSAPAAKAAS